MVCNWLDGSACQLAPRRRLGLLAAAMVILTSAGCLRPADKEVVVYTALDREFSQPVFDEFTRRTGIQVRAKYDTEANKTVGLANLILHERARPRCDVFWNNELLHTLRLQQAGLLAEYRSPVAEAYPAAFRSPSGLWHGFAARARILLVNIDRVPGDRRPRSLEDLLDPQWRGQTGIAKPLFGTTATQAACLFAAWGPERARAFLGNLAEQGVQVFPGNRQVAQAVASGQLAFGLTDTDDAALEIEKGSRVAIVYPDGNSFGQQTPPQPAGGAQLPAGEAQLPAGGGTLVIPNSLAILAGCPHPETARQLVDFLLSAEVEAALAKGPSGQIPLQPGIPPPRHLAGIQDVEPMQVDFAAAAAYWSEAAEWLAGRFGEDAAGGGAPAEGSDPSR